VRPVARCPVQQIRHLTPAMIVLHDGNPLTRIRRAWVNELIVAACIGVFVLQVLDAFPWQRLAFFPQQLRSWAPEPGPLRGAAGLLTYQFLHGSPLHLASNALALLVFGNNLEDALGHRRYALFYLVCGIAAAAAQGLLANPFIPMIGASGSVAAVMGAYLLLHPRARILILAFNIAPVMAPASLVVGFTILTNVAMAYDISLLHPGAQPAALARVAWWAHLGGFAAGISLLLLLKPRDVPLFQAPPPLPAKSMRWLGRVIPTLTWPGDRPVEEPGTAAPAPSWQDSTVGARLLFAAKATLYILLILVLMRYLQ
jgi:membrane associated rhomboid family serine protease